MKYKSINLVEGWLISKNEPGKPIDWVMREISDCQADLKEICKKVIKSLEERTEQCIPGLLYTIQKCFYFGYLLSHICGSREDITKASNYKKADFMRVGRAEFRRCVEFASMLPNIRRVIEEEDLEIGKEFTDIIFWKFKSLLLIEVIWRQRFGQYFSRFFKKLSDGKLNVVLKTGISVLSFYVNDEGFDLEHKFDVRLSDNTIMTCVLQEEEIIKALYTEPLFYEDAGREFCILFDVFYSKAGTEAIAESLQSYGESANGWQTKPRRSMHAYNCGLVSATCYAI